MEDSARINTEIISWILVYLWDLLQYDSSLSEKEHSHGFDVSEVTANVSPKNWLPSKIIQINESPFFEIFKNKTVLYNVNLCFQLISISIELLVEKLLFLICQ